MIGHDLRSVAALAKSWDFELAALGSAVVIAYFVSADGESNWLEGAALLAVYIIFGLAFFIFPG